MHRSPTDTLRLVTPEFLRRLSWNHKSTWRVTPTWVTNGSFIAPRSRLPFQLASDLSVACSQLKEMLHKGNDVAPLTDEKIDEVAWSKVPVNPVEENWLRPKQILPKGDHKGRMTTWLFASDSGKTWALVDDRYVSAFWLKSLKASQDGFIGEFAVLEYNGVVVTGVKPAGVKWDELKTMTMQDYLKIANLPEIREELPLYNPPPRIRWRGVLCH